MDPTRPATAAMTADRCWVATLESQEAGRVCLTSTGGGIAMLHGPVIRPGLERSGLPCRLVQVAARYAQERGCLKLVLRTTSRTERMRDLLRCIGFTPGAAGDTERFYLDLYRRPSRQDCVQQVLLSLDCAAPDQCGVPDPGFVITLAGT